MSCGSTATTVHLLEKPGSEQEQGLDTETPWGVSAVPTFTKQEQVPRQSVQGREKEVTARGRSERANELLVFDGLIGPKRKYST